MTDSPKDKDPQENLYLSGLLMLIVIGSVIYALVTGKIKSPYDFFSFVVPAVFIGVGVIIAIQSVLDIKRPTDVIKLLLTLMLAYGIFSFVFPAVAWRILPSNWELPIAGETMVLVLDDGRQAASTKGVGRIQIYDYSGRYLTGWFVPRGDSDQNTILGTGPDHGLEAPGDSILIDVERARLIILYDAEGRIISQEPRPEYYKAIPKGRFEKRSFESPWYKWPLTHPIKGWVTAVAAIVGFIIMSFVAPTTDDKKNRKAKNQTEPGLAIPSAGTGRPETNGRNNRLAIFFIAVPVIALIVWEAYVLLNGGGYDRPDIAALTLLALPLGCSLAVVISSVKALRASGAFSGRDPLFPKKIFLIGLPAFLLIYAICAFTIPGFTARYFIPAGWEWPMTSTSQALELPGGQKAVRQLSAHRVQIYDADGRYLNGWYLPNGFDLLGPGEPPYDSKESLAVQYSDEKITFDLNGRILHREKLPDYSPLPPTGHFVEMSFHSPWYLWPLGNPLRAWIMIPLSFLLFAFMRAAVRDMKEPSGNFKFQRP